MAAHAPYGAAGVVQALRRTRALTELWRYAQRGGGGRRRGVPQQIGLVVNVGDPSTNTFVTRRSYWLQGLPSSSHLVLVHYLPMEHGMTRAAASRKPPGRPTHMPAVSVAALWCAATRRGAADQRRGRARAAGGTGRHPRVVHHRHVGTAAPAGQPAGSPGRGGAVAAAGVRAGLQRLANARAVLTDQRAGISLVTAFVHSGMYGQVPPKGVKGAPPTMSPAGGRAGPAGAYPGAAGRAPGMPGAAATLEPGGEYYTELEAAAARFKQNHELMEELLLPSPDGTPPRPGCGCCTRAGSHAQRSSHPAFAACSRPLQMGSTCARATRAPPFRPRMRTRPSTGYVSGRRRSTLRLRSCRRSTLRG